jgi:hypothetical protein
LFDFAAFEGAEVTAPLEADGGDEALNLGAVGGESISKRQREEGGREKGKRGEKGKRERRKLTL